MECAVVFFKDLKKTFNRLFSLKINNKGKNNIFHIPQSAYLRKVRIKIYGNNNSVILGENVYLHNVHIRIGFPDCPVDNVQIKIGCNTTFNSADIQLGESKSSLIIGENCMFSFNVEIACSDTHAITDELNNLINVGKNTLIGSNVWICKNVLILKNTVIADGCIVAQNSVVTKTFDEKNSIIAGVPARVVKRNIRWNRKRPQEMLNNDL